MTNLSYAPLYTVNNGVFLHDYYKHLYLETFELELGFFYE